jgi:hypothetical protein
MCIFADPKNHLVNPKVEGVHFVKDLLLPPFLLPFLTHSLFRKNQQLRSKKPPSISLSLVFIALAFYQMCVLSLGYARYPFLMGPLLFIDLNQT